MSNLAYIDQSFDEVSLTRKTFSFRPISLFECRKYVKSLNINKPLGPYEIPAWALKDFMNIIVEPLCYLINAFFYEGKFPNRLKQEFVTPIFNKGFSENPNICWPNSITSALSKVFEKVIREKMTTWISQSSLLNPLQFEFQKKFSTTDALLFLWLKA